MGKRNDKKLQKDWKGEILLPPDPYLSREHKRFTNADKRLMQTAIKRLKKLRTRPAYHPFQRCERRLLVVGKPFTMLAMIKAWAAIGLVAHMFDRRLPTDHDPRLPIGHDPRLLVEWRFMFGNRLPFAAAQVQVQVQDNPLPFAAAQVQVQVQDNPLLAGPDLEHPAGADRRLPTGESVASQAAPNPLHRERMFQNCLLGSKHTIQKIRLKQFVVYS